MRQWFKALLKLHEMVEREPLSPAEQTQYQLGKDELLNFLLAAEALRTPPGAAPRRAVRVVQTLPVHIRLGDEEMQTVTDSLSVGGFSARVANPLKTPPTRQTEAMVSLYVNPSSPLVVRASVVGVAPLARGGGAPEGARASFRFEQMSAENCEKIERVIVSSAMASLNKVFGESVRRAREALD